MTDAAEILRQIDRVEHELAALRALLDGAAPSPDPVLAALRGALGGSWATAAEIWALAQAEAAAAAATGQPEPALAQALRGAGIEGSHSKSTRSDRCKPAPSG